MSDELDSFPVVNNQLSHQPLPSAPSSSPEQVLSSDPSLSNTAEQHQDLSDTSLVQHLPSTDVVPCPRKSSRSHKPPARFTDYICSQAQTTWCNLVLASPISHTCLVAIDQFPEPSTYEQAVKHPGWIEAMNKEITALKINNTWEEVPLPTNKKAISCKWVYKTKLKADGTLERLKARLVIRGFTQQYGIDYEEVFSPVIKMTTIRTILALAAHNKWGIFQLDVNNAFLHGDLDEEVYMQMPKGIPNPDNKVCRLRKSLYGLKQASRQWFTKLKDTLISLGFVQSKNDYSLFLNKTSTNITILAVYVDDILLTGSDSKEIQHVKQCLNEKFGIKDLGSLHFFLGLEVQHTPLGVILSQQKFTRELLRDCGFPIKRQASTPLPLNCRLLPEEGSLLDDPTTYRALVGKLNFLTNTRPDLCFTVQTLSQFLQQPRTSHLQALLHTLAYIQGTSTKGILLSGAAHLKLQAFSDSDWAACPISRRSVSGYLILLSTSPLSWKSKKQSTVSRSSSEAMAQAASEITWLVRLLQELGVTNLTPIQLNCDNQSALHIAKNPVFHERTKHIEIDCHFTRDKVLEGLLQLQYMPTSSQLADVLTKVLPGPHFQELLSKLGMVNSLDHSSLRGGDEHTPTSTVAGLAALLTAHLLTAAS